MVKENRGADIVTCVTSSLYKVKIDENSERQNFIEFCYLGDLECLESVLFFDNFSSMQMKQHLQAGMVIQLKKPEYLESMPVSGKKISFALKISDDSQLNIIGHEKNFCSCSASCHIGLHEATSSISSSNDTQQQKKLLCEFHRRQKQMDDRISGDRMELLANFNMPGRKNSRLSSTIFRISYQTPFVDISKAILANSIYPFHGNGDRNCLQKQVKMKKKSKLNKVFLNFLENGCKSSRYLLQQKKLNAIDQLKQKHVPQKVIDSLGSSLPMLGRNFKETEDFFIDDDNSKSNDK